MPPQTSTATRTALTTAAMLAAPALVTWTGVHVVRTYASMIAWVIGGDLGFLRMVLLLLGIWLAGLLGWSFSRGGRVRWLGVLFALAYTASYALGGPVVGPALGAAAVIAWLWLLPALFGLLNRRGAGRLLAPGLLLGLAGQVGLQSATHGLDLPALRGVGPGLAALALGLLLLAALWRVSSQPEQAAERPGWGLIGLGPYLTLQITVLANLGQVGVWSGWGLAGVSLLVLAGLAGGLMLLAWAAPGWVRAAGGLLALALLSQPGWFAASGGLLVLPVQWGLALALPAVLAPGVSGARLPVRLVGGLSAFIAIALYMEYGNKGTWPQLWLIMAGLAILPAVASIRSTARARRGDAVRAAVGALVLGLLGIGGGLIGRGGPGPATGPAPADLKVMTYNIHQTVNPRGVPDPEAVARIIEGAGPDLVSLQELSRGIDVIDGADLVPWLRWRLPQYHVLFTPTNGDRLGHVILSRYPVLASGSVRFPRQVASEQRSLGWARVESVAGDLLFLSTHFSAYDKEEPDRIVQATGLLSFWEKRPRTILAGDLNAAPESQPVQYLLAGGLSEVLQSLGMGNPFTWPTDKPAERDDYLFTTPDIQPVHAELLPATASDHLPVVAQVRLSH